MMVGYADGHAGDCYQMWNPDTNKVYESRDVVFLQIIFFERPDGPFNSIVKAIPELEEVEASIKAETKDDMELEELIVEAQMNETVEDQLTYQLARKDDDCQVSMRSPITGEKEVVEEVIGNETVEKETVTPKK